MDGAGNGKAALLMLAAMATFCANDAVVKLVIERVPIGEVMALRGVFVVAFMWLALLQERADQAVVRVVRSRRAARSRTCRFQSAIRRARGPAGTSKIWFACELSRVSPP